jgi:hypothetical protein
VSSPGAPGRHAPALAILVLLLSPPAATRLEAASPDWAKPYLKLPVPTGPYIAKRDPWVALRSEISFDVGPSGELRRTFRQVLAPTGGQARSLAVALDYDEVTQSLVEPKVWVPAAFGYKEVDLKKAGLDVPDLDSQDASMITSGRLLLISTRRIDPDEKAILTWQVNDRNPFPGDDVLIPFGRYPAATLSVSSEPAPQGPKLHLTLAEPREGAPTTTREGDFELTDVPAMKRIYDPSMPWSAAAMEALPAIVVQVGRAGSPTWKETSARVAAIFKEPVSSGAEALTSSTARKITAGAATIAEKAARLGAYVQALAYRNVAWGEGAFVPEPPPETLRTMSADCKGKAALLRALLAEVGVTSRPVLCFVGERYRGIPPVPTLHAFNHVVLAIHLEEAADGPASLADGPGRGWTLFDPTDPLSLLGGPPANLEGSSALWLDESDGDLFTVHTRQPGGRDVVVRLEVSLESIAEARFDLTVEGHSDLMLELAGRRIYLEDQDRFRSRCQDILRSVAPGLLVTEAAFFPPDHVKGSVARLQIRGNVPFPMQPVGGGLFTLAAPASIVGLNLGAPSLALVPSTKSRMNEDEKVESAPGWRSAPCCQPYPSHLRGEIHLHLPAGWSAQARPDLKTIDSAWSRVRVVAGPEWSVSVDLPRGRFVSGSSAERERDMTAIAALFKQPFLIATPGK